MHRIVQIEAPEQQVMVLASDIFNIGKGILPIVGGEHMTCAKLRLQSSKYEELEHLLTALLIIRVLPLCTLRCIF